MLFTHIQIITNNYTKRKIYIEKIKFTFRFNNTTKIFHSHIQLNVQQFLCLLPTLTYSIINFTNPVILLQINCAAKIIHVLSVQQTHEHVQCHADGIL